MTGNEETKAKIEKAALDEFMEKGFANASLRQIVKNAGLMTRPPKVRPKKSNFGGRYFYVKIQL